MMMLTTHDDSPRNQYQQVAGFCWIGGIDSPICFFEIVKTHVDFGGEISGVFAKIC